MWSARSDRSPRVSARCSGSPTSSSTIIARSERCSASGPTALGSCCTERGDVRSQRFVALGPPPCKEGRHESSGLPERIGDALRVLSPASRRFDRESRGLVRRRGPPTVSFGRRASPRRRASPGRATPRPRRERPARRGSAPLGRGRPTDIDVRQHRIGLRDRRRRNLDLESLPDRTGVGRAVLRCSGPMMGTP